MIDYLRNRLSEPTTWIGLFLFIAGLALFWFYRQDIYSALVATFGAAIAALAERFMTAPIRALLARLQPAKPALTPRSETMTVATTIADVLADAPDFIKLVQDGVAVEQAVAANGFLAGITTAMTFQADVVKVYNDLLALGVAKAVAAGTVVTAPAA